MPSKVVITRCMISNRIETTVPGKGEFRQAVAQRTQLGRCGTDSDVVHLFLLGAFIEQLLKRDGVGSGLHRSLKALPCPA